MNALANFMHLVVAATLPVGPARGIALILYRNPGRAEQYLANL